MSRYEDDVIDSVTGRDSTQRKRLWDQWQECLNAIDEDLEKKRDPIESGTLYKVMAFHSYISAQYSKANTLTTIDYLKSHRIEAIKKAHKPGWQQIIPLVGQIAAALAGLGLSATPAIAHTTAHKTAALQGGASAAGAAGSICQSLGSWGGSFQQGKSAEASYELQATQRELNEQDQNMQRALQSENTNKENLRQQERTRAETFRMQAG